MSVSSWLQKYFDDSRKKRKSSIQDTLNSLKWEIHPEFLQSFEAFHDRILWIVDENPEDVDVVEGELIQLNSSFKERKRVHQMKKAKTIIDVAA